MPDFGTSIADWFFNPSLINIIKVDRNEGQIGLNRVQLIRNERKSLFRVIPKAELP